MEADEKPIRVPLAVDAQVRFAMGPIMLPARGLIMVLLALPFALAAMSIGAIPSVYRLAFAALLLFVAGAAAVPQAEGVWAVIHLIYRKSGAVIPHLLRNGEPQRGTVQMVGEVMAEDESKSLLPVTGRVAQYLGYFTKVPRASELADDSSIYRLTPGGYRVIIPVEGPAVAMSTATYARWCAQLVNWASQVGCMAQILTKISHQDPIGAREAFEARRPQGMTHSPLWDDERDLVESVAEATLGFRHYVVFSPKSSGSDGVPSLSKLSRANGAGEPKLEDALTVRGSARQLAAGFGIELREPEPGEIEALIKESVFGAEHASAGNGILEAAGIHNYVLTVTKLPPSVYAGMVVNALLNVACRGTACLYITPVESAYARKTLSKQQQLYAYARSKGGADVGAEEAYYDIQNVLSEIAHRTMTPCRVALSIAVSNPVREEAEKKGQQLRAILESSGLGVEHVTAPGLLPLVGLAPGGQPLMRSLLMTSADVAARLVPALGTAFSDARKPLLGTNLWTGAPAYMSVWRDGRTRDPLVNSNAVIMGSTGAGKSVTAKTLLIRHVMEGGAAIVIDPDSEYENVLRCLGGSYIHLGRDALNPLAVGLTLPPNEVVNSLLPVLSVMVGEEKGVKDGRPIRRLRDEDRGRLAVEIVEFFHAWPGIKPADRDEPLLSDFAAFLAADGMSRCVTESERTRLREITNRMHLYTTGRSGEIFNRPSTFNLLQAGSVGIGLREMAMSYAADLTPALAIILNQVCALMAANDDRFKHRIVMVDEAHRITGDPDAGMVLAALSRQIRKYGGALWSATQRVEDFVDTETGAVLISTASTKLILGVEEAAVPRVVEVFKLSPEETKAISPIQPGQGVLISGAERAVVQVMPGAVIWAVVSPDGIRAAGDEEAA